MSLFKYRISDKSLFKTAQKGGFKALCDGVKIPAERLVKTTDKDGYTILQEAAAYNHLDEIPAILEDGATPKMADLMALNKDQKSVFSICAKYGRLDQVLPFISENDPPPLKDLMDANNAFLSPPLHLSTIHGQLDILAKMLPQESKPSITELFTSKDANGSTVFHCAAANVCLDQILDLLPESERLSLEQVQNVKNDQGRSIEDFAAFSQLLPVLKKEDQSKLMAKALKGNTRPELYADEVLTGIEKADGLTLSILASYERKAPKEFAGSPEAKRLTKVRDKLREKFCPLLTPPSKRQGR